MVSGSESAGGEPPRASRVVSGPGISRVVSRPRASPAVSPPRTNPGLNGLGGGRPAGASGKSRPAREPAKFAVHRRAREAALGQRAREAVLGQVAHRATAAGSGARQAPPAGAAPARSAGAPGDPGPEPRRTSRPLTSISPPAPSNVPTAAPQKETHEHVGELVDLDSSCASTAYGRLGQPRLRTPDVLDVRRDLMAVLLANHLRYDFECPAHPGNDRLPSSPRDTPRPSSTPPTRRPAPSTTRSC